MIQVKILEHFDIVKATDYMRPLSMKGSSMGDEQVCRFSMYSGQPNDHCEWVLVKDVLGECWFGATVGLINRKLRKYEFMRGTLPKNMIWNWRAEKKRNE